MRGGVRFVRVAAAVVAAAALTACGGAGPEGVTLPPETTATPSPSDTPNAEPTDSPTPTPTVAAPGELPAAAKKHTSSGAKAFVRHWIAAANYAFATGNTSSWRPLSSDSCGTCKARLKDVEDVYTRGGRIEGGSLTVVSLSASPVDPSFVTMVVADLAVTAESHFDSAGHVSSDEPAERAKFAIYLRWVAGELVHHLGEAGRALMRGSARVLVVSTIVIVAVPAGAIGSEAEDEPPRQAWTAKAKAVDGGVQLKAEQHERNSRTTTKSDVSEPTVRTETMAACIPLPPEQSITGFSATCGSNACKAGKRKRPGRFMFTVTTPIDADGMDVGEPSISAAACVPDEPEPAPTISELVIRQVKNMKLPGAAVATDPSPWTLVNWTTTFTAKPAWTTRDLGRILGSKVTLQITPISYRFDFGDGDGKTRKRGLAMHSYPDRGTMHVSAATTYRASYRVDGGRARKIPGTVTIPGPTTELPVYEARPQLIAGND